MGLLILGPSPFFFFHFSLIFCFVSKPLFCPLFAYCCNPEIDFISFALFVEEFESIFMALCGVKLNSSLLHSVTSKVYYRRMIFLWVKYLSLGKKECRHTIWFGSKKKTVADAILKKGKRWSSCNQNPHLGSVLWCRNYVISWYKKREGGGLLDTGLATEVHGHELWIEIKMWRGTYFIFSSCYFLKISQFWCVKFK